MHSATRALFPTRKISRHVLEEEGAPGAPEVDVGPAALGAGRGKAHTEASTVARRLHTVCSAPLEPGLFRDQFGDI